MSTWRNKAIEIAPALQREFESPDFSIYSVFSELLNLLQESCIKNDVQKIQSIYDYAEWCFAQNDQKLWNATGVAFYEHLGDHDEIYLSIPARLKKEIYKDIRGLLQLRLDSDKLNKLDKHFNWKE